MVRCMVELQEVLSAQGATVKHVETYRTTNESGSEIGYDIYDIDTEPENIMVTSACGQYFMKPIQTEYNERDNVLVVTMWKVEEVRG